VSDNVCQVENLNTINRHI